MTARRRAGGIACAVVTVAALAAAGAAAQTPACLTPVAADGHEPLCNPYQSSPEWGTNHRSSYAQGSSPFPAPMPGDEVRWQDLQFGAEVPVILQFGAPYPDGRRTVWLSTVASPETRAVYKLDAQTGEVISRTSILDEGGSPGQTSTSGVYNLLDRDNRFFTVRPDGFARYGDVRPGESSSPIKLIDRLVLPSRAFCRPDDRIIGITLTYAGEIAFATVLGQVGVVPRALGEVQDEQIRIASINGSRCADASVPDADLEQVHNSLSSDENGGVYVVSTKAQYRFDATPTGLRERWRAEYPSGGGAGGTTLSSGSGSTPDVVGTHPRDDRFVVITDGQRLMHVTYFWRDEIPADWKPIRPGLDRRIACSVPVRFGDESATESISEQSVLTRGYSAVVVNNALPLDDVFTFIPEERRPLATLTSNLPGNGPRGMERIDWDPRTRTCRSVWANPEVSIPNAVPTMSAASGLIYGIGVRSTVFGLEGIDFATGRPVLWVPTSPLPTENSFFAATTIAPGGDVWVGGTTGISVFRGPDRPAPASECRDVAAPRTSLTALRVSPERRLAARGTASDEGCGGLDRVDVSISRRLGGNRCRFVTSVRRARLGAVRPCRRPVPLRAAGTSAWSLRLGAALPPGRYVVRSRGRDRTGNLERTTTSDRTSTRATRIVRIGGRR